MPRRAAKMIMTRIIDRALPLLSAALALAQEFAGGKVEHEGSWAAGSSWEIVPAFRVGAEAFGTVTEADAPGKDGVRSQAWAGPAVSVAWRRVWLVLATGVGLTDASERVRARAILAFQL